MLRTLPIPRGVFALLAMIYLIVMYDAGTPRSHENRVRSTVAGLLDIEPAAVSEITLDGAGVQRRWQRGASGWERSGAPVDRSTEASIETALRLLHRSAPLRVLRPEQTAAVAASTYGLDPPSLRLTIDADDSTRFGASFGNAVNEGAARYVRLAGRGETWIVSGFVFEAWAALTR